VSSPANSGSTGPTLGSVLRELRVHRGLSGKRVAQLAGLSQSKISRIETGLTLPTEHEVRMIARSLDVTGGRLQELLETRRLRESARDWRPGDVDLASRQEDTEQIEVGTTDFKVFQPTVVIGFLQISSYASEVLSALQRLAGPEPPGGPTRAVSARVHRQQVLDDDRKTFDFVMTEAVLSNRVCSAEDMLAQIRHIREVAKRPNVTVSIIRQDLARWTVPPFHAFSIYDDKHVFVDLFDTGLSTHEESDDGFYGRVFAAMKAQATTAIDPILRHHRDRYLRELTRDDPDPG
jgi:transcriptional regulator with XRE-family HTH domain